MASVLILGTGGQLGSELLRTRWPEGARAVGRLRTECDIADPGQVDQALAEIRPTLVVNAAAYTAVDRAEAAPEAAFRTNRDGPATLGAACAARDLPLIHVSTDYVFDGTKTVPYDESDPTAPLGVYGQSKLAGELALADSGCRRVILRTAWVFGAEGQNFVKTMIRLGHDHDTLRVVDDQRGCPTPADSLAAAIASVGAAILAGKGRWGVYHFAGDEPVSWYGFAGTIFDRLAARSGKAPVLTPITTAEYPTAARRPANSVLDCAKIGRDYGVAPPSWRAGLERVLATLGSTD
jgi:dTDP-4-dehydrorhamnose reductase